MFTATFSHPQYMLNFFLLRTKVLKRTELWSALGSRRTFTRLQFFCAGVGRDNDRNSALIEKHKKGESHDWKFSPCGIWVAVRKLHESVCTTNRDLTAKPSSVTLFPEKTVTLTLPFFCFKHIKEITTLPFSKYLANCAFIIRAVTINY